jgi:tol-pal system protein YbgF
MRQRLLVLVTLLLVTGCATRSDMNAVHVDIDEMRARLLATEQSLASVRAEAKEIAEKSSRDALKNLENLRRGTADMQANLEGMRVDVQVLAGKVDDLGQAAKKPLEDITLLKEDTSRRVAAVEERLDKLEQGVDETRSRLVALVKALVPPPTAESLYKQGQDVLKANDFKGARELFLKVLEQFPNHKLSPNARYWVGETYYSEGNFEQAVLEYQHVIKDYPGKDKVPAALLKQGMAFRELGDSKSARFVLKELIDRYPQAEELSLAKELLGKLK